MGLSLTPGAGVTPVPVRGTARGLPPASSLTVIPALRVPFTMGENVTLIAQLAPAASVLGLRGQVSASAKSLAFTPLRATVVIVSGAVPLFVSVIVCAALVVPTF